MTWMIFLIQMIPVIIKLISLAETIWKDIQKSGVSKKEFVMISAKSIIEEKSVTNKDMTDIWSELETPISNFIDITCHAVIGEEKGDGDIVG